MVCRSLKKGMGWGSDFFLLVEPALNEAELDWLTHGFVMVKQARIVDLRV